MTLPPPLTPPKLHRLSVWQLVISIIGLVLSIFSIFGLVVLVLIARSNVSTGTIDVAELSKLVWVLLLAILITIPSIVLSIRRLAGKPSRQVTITNKNLLVASLLIVVWVGLLWLGYRSYPWNFSGALSTLFNIVIIVLPLFLWLTVGRYKLSVGSRQRSWGIINFSVFFTAPLITIIEVLIVAVIAIMGIASLAQNAEFMPYLQLFQSQGQLDPAALESLQAELTPLLTQPGLYLLIGLVFCLLVPILEELFKPLAVWALAGRKITPAEGWAVGMLCGATFAALESLSLISIAGTDIWLTTAIGRVGTGLLHVLTAGLSGYALAKTWQDRHFLRISLVYLGVIILHGCWNFFALLMGVSQLPLPISVPTISALMSVSTWVLGSLAALMAIGIWVINYLLRRQQARAQSVPAVFQVEPEEPTA